MKSEILIEQIANGFLVSGNGNGRFYASEQEGVCGLIASQLMKVFEKKGMKYPITITLEVKYPQTKSDV